MLILGKIKRRKATGLLLGVSRRHRIEYPPEFLSEIQQSLDKCI